MKFDLEFVRLEKQLPPTGREVLVCLHKAKMPLIAWLDKDGIWHESQCQERWLDFSEVYAWADLPDCPKEGEL
jgi:hypothetical protein